MKKLFLVLACLLSMAELKAQVDDDFWYVTSPGVRGIYSGRLGRIHLDYDAFFEPATIEKTTYFVNPNTNQLDSDFLAAPLFFNNRATTNLGIWSLDQYDYLVGVHVHSSELFTTRFRLGDFGMLKGRQALGTRFLIPVPDILPAHSIQSNIELIATHDSTIVLFTPTADLSDGTAAGQTVAIHLRRGQTFWAQALSDESDSQLGGSSIISNYPIVVHVTATDIVNPDFPTSLTPVVIDDQILPEDNLGKSYAIVTNGDNSVMNADYAAVYATGDNTVVTLNGEPLSPTLSRGEHLVVLLADTINFLQANHPISVFHTICRNGDYDGATVHPLGCGGSQMARLSYPFASELYIVAPTDYINQFRVSTNPAHFDHPFRPVPGNSAYSWTIFHNSNSGGPIMTNDSCAFQLCYIEQAENRTFITYPSAFASPADPYFRMDTTDFCSYDVVRFDHANHNLEQFEIHGPHNIHLSSSESLSFVATDTSYSGWYYISGTTAPGCYNTIDTFYDSIYINIYDANVVSRYDTIVENQFPWTYLGYTFTHPVDTIISLPTDDNTCDTVVLYHLFAYPNIYDTIRYYICDDELPFVYQDDTLRGEGTLRYVYEGMNGVDSNVVVSLHVVPSTEVYIYDTIVDSQLPWYALDTVFTDTVSDYLYRTYNEAGCDSVVHYSLYIFWGGDHCDTSLTYPNVVTPNGDGINDRFVIGGLLENHCFRYNELTIFNREGNAVYHKRNITSESDWWDPSAQHAPAGTYFFIFKAHGINIHTMHNGAIEVLR